MADFINFEADISNDKSSSSDDCNMSDDGDKTSFNRGIFIDNLQTLKMILEQVLSDA